MEDIYLIRLNNVINLKANNDFWQNEFQLKSEYNLKGLRHDLT